MKRSEIFKHVYPKKVICGVGINYFIFHSCFELVSLFKAYKQMSLKCMNIFQLSFSYDVTVAIILWDHLKTSFFPRNLHG